MSFRYPKQRSGDLERIRALPFDVSLDVSTHTAETLRAFATAEDLEGSRYYAGDDGGIRFLLEEFSAESLYRERRKTRAKRRRHEMAKYWIRNELAERLEALRKALEAEGENEKRFSDVPGLIDYLLSLHEQADAHRTPPLGGFVGGIEELRRCEHCDGPVARVYGLKDKLSGYVSPRHPDRTAKALRELRDYTPEWAPTAVSRGNDPVPPLFSVRFLGELIGPAEAAAVIRRMETLEQALAAQDSQTLCSSCGGPVYETTDAAGNAYLVRVRTPSHLAESFAALKDYVPKTAPEKVLRSYEQNGAPKGEVPPLFSEVFLYEIVGKDTARSVLGRLRELGETLGIKESW